MSYIYYFGKIVFCKNATIVWHDALTVKVWDLEVGDDGLDHPDAWAADADSGLLQKYLIRN